MRTIILATFFLVTGVIHSRAGIYDSTEIVKVVERVCDYGLKLYPSTSDNEWEAGTFYTGVMAAYYATGQKRFLDSANAWATFNNWKLISNGADEICCGQTYCELYMLDPKPENAYKIASLASTCGGYKGEGPWGWCDALFMAPPAIIRLGAATGNSSLFSSVSKGWKATTDGLFDYEAGLIYRDGGYFYPAYRQSVVIKYSGPVAMAGWQAQSRAYWNICRRTTAAANSTLISFVSWPGPFPEYKEATAYGGQVFWIRRNILNLKPAGQHFSVI